MSGSSVSTLMLALASKGIRLSRNDEGSLRVTFDEDRPPIEEDLEILRQLKPELLSHLERFDRATAQAAGTLEQIRRRIDWTDSLRLEDGRDARPAIFSVLEEYARLIEQARTRFDVDRLEEITEAAIAFASRWGIVLPSREAA